MFLYLIISMIFSVTMLGGKFIEKIFYNIIVNYLLNRKQSQCNDNGISMKCFVLGIIDGIKYVDLYILLENLIDNAIEATKKTGKKRVDFSMYADQGSINIEIGNSVEGNIKVERFKMEITKEDKKDMVMA